MPRPRALRSTCVGVLATLVGCGAPAAPADGPAAPAPDPMTGSPAPSDSPVAAAVAPVPKDSQNVAPPHVPKDSKADPAPVPKDSQADPAPVPKDSQADPAPVPKDSQTAPAPAVPVPPPVPAVSQRVAASSVVATGPDGPRTLHLAAVRDGDVVMHPLVGGGLALRGDGAFAVVPPGAGAPQREQAWLRDLTDPDGDAIETATVLGGRWPDAAFFGFTLEYARSSVRHPVQRWRDDRWVDVEMPPVEPPLVSFHVAYAGGADGAVLGLRGHDLGDVDPYLGEAELRKMRAVLRRVRPTVDRLDAATPVAWPELPVGPVGTGLLAFPDGTLVVMRSGPKLQRWTPGAKKWASLPAVGYTATGYYDGPELVGRDPARIYLFSCADTLERESRLHRLTDGAWQPIAPPGGKCVYSLSEDADGGLWMVAMGELYYHPAPGPPAGATPSPAWQAIAVPKIPLPARPRSWWFNTDVDEWNDLPALPAREQALYMSRVAALGPGDVWLAGDAGDSLFRPGQPYKVVLTTRPIDAPIVLPDPGRTALEALGLSDAPVGAECVTPTLELGAVTDAPATARPPALVGDALFGLAVVASESGARHDISVLYMTRTPPGPEVMAKRLGELAATLRPSFPQLRLTCRPPRIVDVLQ